MGVDWICTKCGKEFNSGHYCSNGCGQEHVKVLNELPPRPPQTHADLVRMRDRWNLAYPVGMTFECAICWRVKTLSSAFINGNKVFVNVEMLGSPIVAIGEHDEDFNPLCLPVRTLTPVDTSTP